MTAERVQNRLRFALLSLFCLTAACDRSPPDLEKPNAKVAQDGKRNSLPSVAETVTDSADASQNGTAREGTLVADETAEPPRVRYRETRFLRDQDRFLPADNPAVHPVSDELLMSDDEDVLGFVIGQRARAYSVRALSYHHVVNDTVGDVPLAVTY